MKITLKSPNTPKGLVTDMLSIPINSTDQMSDYKDKQMAALSRKFCYLADTMQEWVKACERNAFDAKFTRKEDAERKREQDKRAEPRPEDTQIGR